MSAHECSFGPPQPRGTVGWCQLDGCDEFAIANDRRFTEPWRAPTIDERIAVVDYMLQTVCMAEALLIVNGPDHGRRKIRELLGVTPREAWR